MLAVTMPKPKRVMSSYNLEIKPLQKSELKIKGSRELNIEITPKNQVLKKIDDLKNVTPEATINSRAFMEKTRYDRLGADFAKVTPLKPENDDSSQS